jgi:hypothetical protein
MSLLDLTTIVPTTACHQRNDVETYSRSKDTYLSTLYQRRAVRRGKKRALIAVAPSMMRNIFHMLSHHEVYRELGTNYFDERRQFTVDRLTQRIEHLGYRVHLEPVTAPVAEEIFKATGAGARAQECVHVLYAMSIWQWGPSAWCGAGHPRMVLMTSSTLATHAMRGKTMSMQVSCSCTVPAAQQSRTTTQS